MTFRRRPFPEVLDNLLADVAGGVAAEEHPFPPPGAGAAPPFRHSLESPPVAEVVSVYGSRDGQAHQFRRDKDYRLLPDNQTLEWPQGAELPDPGTLVAVSYFPQSAQPVLTDLQTGSVVRTLAEAVALEMGRLSAELEAVYRSGFVDTAAGGALDGVVSLLGIARVQGGRAAGEVELRRAAGTRGAIAVPAGTRVMTADGSVEYETTDAVTLADGQTALRVHARDLERNDPLPAGALTVLPVPIAGIAGVTNPAPTAIATAAESDEQLRARAKDFLHGSERATLGALRHAVARQQIAADVDEDPDQPGRVVVTPHVDAMTPELQERLLRALEDARPAGVTVELAGVRPPARVDLELRLTTAPGLTEQDLRAAQRAVGQQIAGYFSALPSAHPGSVNRIVGLALAVPQVQDVRLVSARVAGRDVLRPADGTLDIGGTPTVLGELHLADPALPTRVSVVVTFPPGSEPPDQAQIQAALSSALAVLNDRNAPPATPQSLAFAKVLRVLPLPGKPGMSLADVEAGAPGALPLPTAAGVLPQKVVLAVSRESGVTQTLEHDGDAYALSPFERLELAGAEVQQEAAHA